MFKRIATALLLRAIARDLATIASTLKDQTFLLARLADRFAPPPIEQSPADRATIKADTGVSHLDVDDAAFADYIVARAQASTGHTPDEDEILIALADEKTTDLQERLAARDDELARLMEARR
jgi:hypothetical protein